MHVNVGCDSTPIRLRVAISRERLANQALALAASQVTCRAAFSRPS